MLSALVTQRVKEIFVKLFALNLQAATLLLLVASFGAYAGRGHKLLELLSHFRVQYLLGALACLALLLSLRSWSWAIVAALCCAVNLAHIVPRYLPASNDRDGAPANSFKLMLANVNFDNTQHERFVACVTAERPDLLVVQEVDHRWIEGMKPLEAAYPFRVAAPVDGDGSGIALFSRLPLEDARVINLGDEAEGVRPSITARVLLGGRFVSLLTIHPRAPIRAGHFELRNAQLADAARFAREMPEPRVFVGDLNTTVWSPYIADFLRDSNLRDARRGSGLLPTFPTFAPLGSPLMLPIDHCFVGEKVHVNAIRTGAPTGSDHLPLIVELNVDE